VESKKGGDYFLLFLNLEKELLSSTIRPAAIQTSRLRAYSQAAHSVHGLTIDSIAQRSLVVLRARIYKADLFDFKLLLFQIFGPISPSLRTLTVETQIQPSNYRWSTPFLSRWSSIFKPLPCPFTM